MIAVTSLITYLSSVSYLAIFFFFILTGFGIPIPEELSLLVLGYLASIDVFELFPVMAVSFIAIMASDNLGYYLGRNTRWIRRFIPAEKFALAKKHFHQHGGKTIFFSRFVCVLRVLFPIVAGSVGMKWKKFFLIDTSAIIIMVPTFTLVGYYFGHYMEKIAKFVIGIDRIILVIVAAVIVIGFVSYRKIKRKRSHRTLSKHAVRA
ncbi:DedA family protein [Candidatus Woesearchaeota archaeon]|nr:DedA family protein [Candidatus Woesearchaeota archaeon]